MALHKLPKSYSSDFSNPDKKPVGITDINYKHPFNRRVRHIWGAYRGPSIVNDGYGFGVPLEFYYDIVSGIAPHTYLVSGNDAPEFRPNKYGTAAHYKNVGDSFRGSYIQEGGMFLADHDGTMLFCGELNSVTGTQFLIGQSNSGVSPIYKYGCALAVVDGVLYAWRSSNNTNQKVSLPVDAGKVIAAVSFSGSNIKLSVNGVSVSGVCHGSGTAYNFGFGRDAQGNNAKNRSDMDGSINMAAISYHPLSEAELNALTLKPYDILKPKQAPIYFTSDVGGGTPTLYPSFIPSAEEFYTASVENMLSVIEPNFIATQESIYNPEVSPQGVTILPDYIPSEEVVYSPTVADLLQVLSPDFIPTEETVYSPEVERLLQLLYPSYIESEEATYRPTVTGGDSISIPLTDRRTWNAVAQYLRDLVFTGQDNDVIQKWFLSEGYEGEYNENWNNYLADQGYTDGNLSDKYSAWRKQ